MTIRINRNWFAAQAFTLIEVLMAVVAVAVMFVSLYLALTMGFGIVQLARENLRATQILEERMETIRLYTWDQLNTPGFVPTRFTEPFFALGTNTSGVVYGGQILITNAVLPSAAYTNDLRLVIAEVRWTSGSVVRRRSMQTLVSRYGLQNYIF